jgi:hypothetical protein
MAEIGPDLETDLSLPPVFPTLSVSTGLNPLPTDIPLVQTIDNFSTPSIPAPADLSQFIMGNAEANPRDPYKAFMDIASTPTSESDIAINKSRPYTFASGYKRANFDRYYNDTENFYKLGFNPYANNEELYNSNRSWYEDLGRAASGIPNMGYSFIKSIYGSDTGDEYAKYNAIYGSTQGGVSGFTSNLVLNTAPFLAIGADWLVTEAVLAGITVATGGLAAEATVPLAVAKTVSTGEKLKTLINTFRSANAMRETFTAANVGKAALRFGEAVTPFASTGKALFETGKAVGQGEKVLNAARMASNIGTFVRDSKKLSYAFGEANLEGDMGKNEFIDNRIAEFINDNGYYPDEAELSKIYEFAEDSKFTTTMINMPLLYLSNGIVFDNLFKGGTKSLFKPNRAIVKNFSKTGQNVVIEDGVAKLTTGFAENLKFAAKGLVSPRNYGNFAVNYFGANVAEGLQEVAQEVVAGASDDYYTALYKTPEGAGVAMYLAEAYNNLKEQNSAQGAEVFASGFLLGGLASIGTTAVSNVFNPLQKLYSQRDPNFKNMYNQESEQAKKLVDDLNDAFKNGYNVFTPDVENLLVQIKLGQDMVDAKLSSSYDEKAFHDLKDMSRFNSVYTALETGNFNILIDKLKNMQEMTGAELKDAFNLDNSVTDEEAKKVLSVALERAYQIEGQYDQFKDIQNPFNPNKFKKYNLKDNPENQKAYFDEVAGYYGFEEARKTAVFNLHGVKQATKRLSDLVDQMTKITSVGNLAFTDIKSVLSSESLQDEIDTLEDEIFTLGETTDPKLKTILKNKQRKQKDLTMFKKEFDKIQEMEDSTLIEKRKALKKAFTKYINRLVENNNEIIPADQLDNLFGLLSDYYSLSKDVRKYNNNVTALTDPTNFYAEALRRINARRVRMDKMQEYMQEAVKTFTNVKKSNDLINDIADAGFTIDPKTINEQAIADYDSFVNTLLNDADVKFIDVNSGNSFGKDDPRFESIKDVIENFNKELVTEESETQVSTTEVVEEEVVDQPAISDEIEQEEGIPLIQSVKQFNVLPVKLQGLLRATLAQQNSKREADGEPELPLDRFLRTSTSRNAISKFFKDPANTADIKAYNEKKGVPKEQSPKATPTQPTDTRTITEKKTTKTISSEIVEKGNRKGQTRTVTQTNSIEDVEDTIVSVTEYEAKVGDTTVTLGGKTMTVKEFKEEFPLDEDYQEVFEGLDDDAKITVRKVKRTPTSSRFDSIVSIVSAEFGKMDVGIKKDDAKYDAELAALEQFKEKVKEVVVAEPVTEAIDPIVEKIKNANSIQELNTLQEEFEESDLIEDLDNINAVKDAVALRKAELTKSIKYESIKAGDVLVFGDNKYGLVEKVTTSKLTVVPLYGERLTPAKDANKRITILKKDFSKMVQSVYDTQANVVIGANDVPSPTTEEKDLINKNVELQNNFLTDKKARETARLKDADRSADDVSNEFLNKLGC